MAWIDIPESTYKAVYDSGSSQSSESNKNVWVTLQYDDASVSAVKVKLRFVLHSKNSGNYFDTFYILLNPTSSSRTLHPLKIYYTDPTKSNYKAEYPYYGTTSFEVTKEYDAKTFTIPAYWFCNDGAYHAAYPPNNNYGTPDSFYKEYKDNGNRGYLRTDFESTSISIASSDTVATDGGNPSIPTLKDNGNNTVALEVKQGKSGTNNALTGTTLTYTIDGGSAKPLSITTKSEGTASYTIDVPNTTIAGSTGCTIKVTIKCTFEHNSTTASKSVTAYYYIAPSTPGKPALAVSSYKNNRLTIKQNWTYTWAAATQANSNSPVKGYWIRIWRWSSSYSKNNGWQVVHSTQWEGSTTSYTFNPANLGFVAKDRVQVEVAAYSINGKGSKLWSAKSGTYQYEHPSGETETFELYTLSDISTVQNAGIVQVKVNNTWKEGQVWVKVNGAWKEAETVNVKVNGSWKESQ